MVTSESCPYCGSGDVKIKFLIESKSILRCYCCSLMWLHPLPSIRELKDIYDEDYYANPHFFSSECACTYGYSNIFAEKKHKQLGYNAILSKIFDLHDVDNNKLLDVGCGPGFFLESSIGYGFVPTGLEFNPFARKYIESEYHFTCYPHDLLQMDENSKFGVITMFDVVEHLLYPFKSIVKVASMLPNNGLFVMSTMDCGSIPSKILGKHNEDIRRISEHVFFFNKRLLFRILEEAGFKILHCQYIGHTFTLPDLAKRIGQLFPFLSFLSNIIIASNMFKNTKIYLNPFTKIIIYAQKVGEAKC